MKKFQKPFRKNIELEEIRMKTGGIITSDELQSNDKLRSQHLTDLIDRFPSKRSSKFEFIPDDNITPIHIFSDKVLHSIDELKKAIRKLKSLPDPKSHQNNLLKEIRSIISETNDLIKHPCTLR